MTTTMPLNTALTVRLRDGRTLGYAEYGDPASKPVFFFHGFPGSRLWTVSQAGRHWLRRRR